MPDEINQASVRRFETRILANHPLTPTIYDLRVEHPHPDFTPGQFVNIYLNRGDWLLPRPISVADSGGGWIRLIYAVVGKGTERLSALQPGDKIDVTTILGHGFSIDSASTVIAVGGGVGVPPVYAAAKKAASAGKKVVAIIGFRSDPILLNELAASIGAENVRCAIEDGKAVPALRTAFPEIQFETGTVLTILKQLPVPKEGKALIVSCGPGPMMKAIQAFAPPDRFNLQFSLEERMGCGFGCCAGCVADIRDRASGAISRMGVCSKGPVFAGETVVFNA